MAFRFQSNRLAEQPSPDREASENQSERETGPSGIISNMATDPIQDKTVSTPVTPEDLHELDRISKASGIPVARLLECALLEYLDGKSRERSARGAY